MKILFGIIGAALAILVIAVIVIGMNLDRGVQHAIERYGPEIIGTGVRVEDVSLSIFDGSGELFGLRVDNPPGFDAPHALVLERLKLAVELSSLGSDALVLNEVSIDSPVIVAERRGATTNLNVLYDNLGGESTAGAQSSEADALRVLIRHFALRNASATLSSGVGRDITVKLPDIELENVGQDSAVTLREFLRQVLRPINTRIAKAAMETGLEQAQKLKADAAGGVEQARKLEDEAGAKARELMDRFKRE